MNAYVSAWPELRVRDLLGGGELKPRPFPLSSAGTLYSYVARNAIYHLFRALVRRGDQTVLVPSYHHGNEIRAVRAAGARLRFYPIGRDLQPDMEALARLATSDVRVLFVIHYIGFPQDMEAITAFCRERGLILVEDCALAFLSRLGNRSLGTFGDYSIFCLYKTLPVPNGGVLAVNGRPLEGLRAISSRACGTASVAGRTAELLLESFRSRHPRMGAALAAAKRGVGRTMDAVSWRRVPVGDSGFDTARTEIGMSDLCRRLLPRFDYEEVWRRRRDHYLYLADRLAGHVRPLRATLPDGACPLFFPILVRDKARAARALSQRGIGAVELWNEGDPECAGGRFPETDELRRHVLELPLHQSLSRAQLDYMADEVRHLDVHAG
jgi:dTDP-4-amino-4,6-dideoxygalactose transaminase